MSLKTDKKDKKKESAHSLDLIRSDGKKRKFFLKDEEVRNNLNKRQLKLLEKSMQARSSTNHYLSWVVQQSEF